MTNPDGEASGPPDLTKVGHQVSSALHRVIDALREWSKDDDPAVRIFAIMGLLSIGTSLLVLLLIIIHGTLYLAEIALSTPILGPPPMLFYIAFVFAPPGFCGSIAGPFVVARLISSARINDFDARNDRIMEERKKHR